MVTIDLARRLRAAGLTWTPRAGDRFVVHDREMDEDVFFVSDMTIQAEVQPTGSVIRFNGTTEWALDDVEKDATIWLPREDQLRELLGGAFLRLERAGAAYQVVATVQDEVVGFSDRDVETAYAQALLHVMVSRPVTPHWS